MSVTNFILPKFRRLRLKEDFDRIFKEAGRCSGSGLTVRVLPNGLSYSRLGLMIGKKAGNAVTRNRVRRILREYFRLETCGLDSHLDIVVTAYKPMVRVSNQDIRTIFSELLKHKNLR